jgi:hypothetical protein
MMRHHPHANSDSRCTNSGSGPPKRVQRHFAGLVIAAYDQEFLAGRGVPVGWVVVYAAVAHVHAIDNGIP